ncbi:MAG TPA: DUF6335 family protein [Trichocoleus sp.]|jgi:hypothetical protein
MPDNLHPDAQDPSEFVSNMPPDDDDELEDEVIYGDDVPQELTESYGTGVQELPGLNIGGRTMRDRRDEAPQGSEIVTGGDVDANWYQASVVGDESVGGTVNTPDMSIVEEVAAAVGIQYDDNSFLRTEDMLEQRDDRRWELDPASSEDYGVRREERQEE